MNQMKLQIALDYLMVFIFILFIFTLIFASVAKERVLVSNQQTFTQLQLVASAVASEISSASQAGNGYSASILLPPQLSILNYNISITRQGMVIASANIVGQTIQATSVSLVQNIVSNVSYLSQSKLFYVIPTVTSTGYITLENSFGTVCVDYQCPSTANQSSQMAISDQLASGLQLNGFNTNAVYTGAVTSSKVESISFWVKPTVVPAVSSQYIIDQGQSPTNNNWIGLLNGKIVGGPSLIDDCGSVLNLQPNKWYFITYTVSSSLNIYINGNAGLGCNKLSVTGATPQYLNIGQLGNTQNRFNGTIANLQIYNSSLTTNQIFELYQEGINGAPVLSANNLPSNIVAWYPLLGNGNDYSGNARNLLVDTALYYPAFAQVFATVRNSTGAPLNNVSVGFITNSGTFVNSQALSNATNTNGIAYAFINQGATGGYANIKAVAFNGNSTTKGNVIAWYPMSDGQGMVLHDVSNSVDTQSTLNGNIVGAYWANPNYAAKFDGKTSSIQLQNVPQLQSGTVTVAAWVNYAGPSSQGQYNFIAAKNGAWNFGTCNSILELCDYNPSTGAISYSTSTLSAGKWYLLAKTIGGGTQTTYVDGIEVLSSSSSMATQSNGISIGYSTINSNPFFFNGTIADFQVYSSALTQGQISAIYNLGIDGAPFQIPNLIGWWPLNGDANDYSGNNNNGIIYGNLNNAPIGLQQGTGSQSLAGTFNGVNSQIALGTDSNVMPNTNITVTGWVKTSASQATQPIVYQGSPGAGLGTLGYILYLDNNAGQFTVMPSGGSACTVTPSASSTLLNNNQWHFLVGTYNGFAVTLYVDGAQAYAQSCASSSTPINYPVGSVGVIGAVGTTSSSAHFSGQLSDIEVYNGLITSSQIQQLYQEGITGLPKLNSGLTGWWPLNGDTNDYSTNNYPGIAANIVYYAQSVIKSNLNPSLNGAGIAFNVLGSNIVVGNNIPINGPFTVSAWVNPGIENGAVVIVGKNNAFRLGLNAIGNMEGDFWSGISGGLQGPVFTPYKLSPNQWYMLAGTYNGIAVSIYLNGVPVNTVTASGSPSANSNPTVIGASEISPYSTKYFNGTIADVQVYNSGLNASQIYRLYNAGAPPSASISIPLGASP